jgi:hypothetical protein
MTGGRRRVQSRAQNRVRSHASRHEKHHGRIGRTIVEAMAERSRATIGVRAATSVSTAAM